ncbi:hypothetical protein SBBP2_220018 [Burkholderiales bacterium]|nr:hypothetical protein SBBP2_220018 [Burkholderiales bacterium]
MGQGCVPPGSNGPMSRGLAPINEVFLRAGSAFAVIGVRGKWGFAMPPGRCYVAQFDNV